MMQYQIEPKQFFERISPDYKIEVIEWNHDKDHVNILFKAHSKSDLSKFINTYKSASSRLLKKNFHRLKANFGRIGFGRNRFV